MRSFWMAAIGLATVLAPILASRPAAAATTLTCPQRAPAGGWGAPAKPAEPGAGAWTLFDGPPADQASLAPDSDSRASQTFLLDAVKAAWVQCRVGTGPVFEQRLPDGLRRCVVSYKRAGKSLQFANTMTCS